jgi:hypothetical protein
VVMHDSMAEAGRPVYPSAATPTPLPRLRH